MAVTAGEIKRTLLFQMTGPEGYAAYHQLSFKTSEVVPDLMNFADLYVPRLYAVTDCEIYAGQLIIEMGATDTVPADPTSDVSDTMTIILENDQAERSQVNVPAINPALILATGPYADLMLDDTLPGVVNYLSTLIDGAVFCNDQGYDHTGYLASVREQGRQGV
jgi:hypothetical protein